MPIIEKIEWSKPLQVSTVGVSGAFSLKRVRPDLNSENPDVFRDNLFKK